MMFEFTESILIKAELDRVWPYLTDIQYWWIRSNPEHLSLEILDKEKRLAVGTKIRIREKIAGIPGEAVGELTEYVERDRVTWKADVAQYHLWGVPLKVTEGVRWSLRPADDGVELSATVWAVFPAGIKGRLVEWLFRGPLDGVTKDRRHARRELEYIKQDIEQG